MSDSTDCTRRRVLHLLASGVAGSLLLPSLARAAAPTDASGDRHSAGRIGRIGLQLYTVRAALSRDLEGTIAAVAAAGITELEFAGYFNKPPEWWRELLQRHQLTAPATHEALPRTDDGFAAIVERAKAMGHDMVIVPFVGPEYRGTRENWKKLATRLNSGAEVAKAAGLRFGYHNHDFEFAPVDGTTGYDILTSETDPALVTLELDVYWAVKAGRDPMALMAAHAGRVICCHVKDAGPAPERQMRDVGAGTIDYRQLLAVGRTQGLKHWFIEHDQPTDPLQSIRASAAAMRGY